VHLTDVIKKKIRSSGPITFAEYMQMALYDPYFGYYTTKLNKIGKEGDFVTAPEVSSLFGYSLAVQIQQILKETKNPIIFEFGAGTGKLCIDILTALEKCECLPDFYYILEVSGQLQENQKQLITSTIPHLSHKIRWLTTLPKENFQGVIIANEVLDAMPVSRFMIKDSVLFEGYITIENENLQEIFQINTNNDLEDYVKNYITYDNYISEANLVVRSWCKELSRLLSKGAAIIIDYGFPMHEYYHEDRNGGTIMCHYQQTTNSNPLINIGNQDITAHVNFTQVAEAAFANGFDISGYTNQASFLINCKVLDFLKDFENNSLVMKNQEIKILLHPSEMGEIFKVMALTKQMNIDLVGFKINDKRASL